MNRNYTAFVGRMIQKYEGGYCWDAGDPGGPTKYGITCYDLAAHRGQKMTSMATWAPIVKAMELPEAEGIYATKYAQGVRFNDLQSGVDCVMFDYAVNSGVSRPIRVAQAILKLPQTGRMDRETLVAIRAADAATFINAMCDERLAFMHRIRGGSAWEKFGKGWGARVADLRKYAVHLAETKDPASAPEAPDLSNVPTPKATNVDPTTTKSATTGTIGGTAGSAATVQATANRVWITVCVVAACVAVGIAVAFYLSHKQAAKDKEVVL